MEEMKEGGAKIAAGSINKQTRPGMEASFYTAKESVDASQTFFEGELSWKTGKLSKTKVFAVLLKGRSSFFVVD